MKIHGNYFRHISRVASDSQDSTCLLGPSAHSCHCSGHHPPVGIPDLIFSWGEGQDLETWPPLPLPITTETTGLRIMGTAWVGSSFHSKEARWYRLEGQGVNYQWGKHWPMRERRREGALFLSPTDYSKTHFPYNLFGDALHPSGTTWASWSCTDLHLLPIFPGSLFPLFPYLSQDCNSQ